METKIVRQRVADLIERVREEDTGDVLKGWADTLESALAGPAGGTVKKYLTAQNGASVDTFQITARLDDEGVVSGYSSLWMPAARTVQASATSASLDGSGQHYSGVKTISSAGGVYLGYIEHETSVQLVAYRPAGVGRY